MQSQPSDHDAGPLAVDWLALGSAVVQAADQAAALHAANCAAWIANAELDRMLDAQAASGSGSLDSGGQG